jgi:hypothetical protein
VLAAALFALSTPVFAGPPRPETAAQRVCKALDQTIDLDITEQPLQLAINQVHEQTGLNFVVDRMTLSQMGIDVDSLAVNFKQQNVKVRSALRSILGQFELGFAVLEENILVTTDAMALVRLWKQKISIDLDRVPLVTALKDLAGETGAKLVFDKKVAKEAQAEVSLQLDDVAFDAVVRLLCDQADLKPIRLGNVLYVTTKAKAIELRKEGELVPGAADPQPVRYPPVANLGVVRFNVARGAAFLQWNAAVNQQQMLFGIGNLKTVDNVTVSPTAPAEKQEETPEPGQKKESDKKDP